MRRREFRAELVDLLVRAWPIEDADDDRDDAPPDAATPVHLLLVVDWQGSDGKRWISYHGALGSGDEAPPWIDQMLAHEVIEWDEDDEP